jgi:hypothetical protein
MANGHQNILHGLVCVNVATTLMRMLLRIMVVEVLKSVSVGMRVLMIFSLIWGKDRDLIIA